MRRLGTVAHAISACLSLLSIGHSEIREGQSTYLEIDLRRTDRNISTLSDKLRGVLPALVTNQTCYFLRCLRTDSSLDTNKNRPLPGIYFQLSPIPFARQQVG
ncbi:hypothetical protein F4824DRAFT_436461 [Ustulina deusta]|nr:hypothetical protein F4824DRAFT_436461 [Ustulina deusta]